MLFVQVNDYYIKSHIEQKRMNYIDYLMAFYKFSFLQWKVTCYSNNIKGRVLVFISQMFPFTHIKSVDLWNVCGH